MERQKARLEEHYLTDIRPALGKALGIENVMAIPKLEKIVVNIGVSAAVADSKVIPQVEQAMAKITGQSPVRTKSKKSIAGFKLRDGIPIGVMVTLRRRRMYEFLDKLINFALPKVRDFQGVGTRLDGRGNYNLGIKEWIIFPELEDGYNEKMYGMNVTIHTSATTDEHGLELLKQFGMPFKKK
jgi:large subunit ribosomal protein L5